MKKKPGSTILLFSTLLLLFFSAYFTFKGRIIAVDFFVIAAFLSLFIYFEKRKSVSPFFVVLSLFIFIPHILGILGLYELASIDYNYDKIAHIIGSFFGTIVIVHYLRRYTFFRKSLAATALIALSIVMMFGTLIEISEYWGFRLVGFGEGYLGFGKGDNSKNFGPWENSSIDSTLNLLGGMVGIFIYGIKLLFMKYKK